MQQLGPCNSGQIAYRKEAASTSLHLIGRAGFFFNTLNALRVQTSCCARPSARFMSTICQFRSSRQHFPSSLPPSSATSILHP